MSSTQRWRLGGGLLALALTACGGGEPIAGDAGPDDGGAEAPPEAVGVETLAPAEVRAGQLVNVTCELIDADGVAFVPSGTLNPTVRVVPEDSIVRTADGLLATTVGEIEVSCAFGSLSLADATPARVTVRPGEPAVVETVLDRDRIEAGESVTASCTAFDAFGNRVPDAAPTFASVPEDEANTIEGLTGTYTDAGLYVVRCDLVGAVSRGVPLEVLPSLPAELVVALVPNQALYANGQVIALGRVVTDRFGNEVTTAAVPVVASPEGQTLGDGRFRFAEDGRYTLTATVDGPTFEDRALTASVTVLVDGNGPAVNCESPADGSILQQAPGSPVTLRGTVSDVSGVREVRVDGELAAFEPATGAFSAEVTTRFGINFVDVAAVDTTGRETSRTCAFLVSQQFQPDARTLSSTISLALRQAAVDDGDTTGPVDSLNDIIFAVANSPTLSTTINDAVQDIPTLNYKAGCVTFFGSESCITRATADPLRASINGPNSTSLSLIDDGLAVGFQLRNVAIRLRVTGRLLGIDIADTTGDITVRTADLGARFRLRLVGGAPSVEIVPGSVEVTLGALDTSFDGLDGAIVNLIVDIARGAITDLVENELRAVAETELEGILDGVLGALDVSSLDTRFSVPRLDGAGTVDLSFGVGFNALSTTTDRILFGIGSRIRSTPTVAFPTLGVPYRAGMRLRDPGGPTPAGVALHEGILGQALHALWRAGFLEARLEGDALGGTELPPGVAFTTSLGLPPVVETLPDGRVRLSLGALRLGLESPGLFPEPIDLNVGVRATLTPSLRGEDLSFGDFTLEELVFSTDAVSLDMETRETIEGFLTRLFGSLLGDLLDDALPALPVPSFPLPPDVTDLGVPAGNLGIVDPVLETSAPHFLLRGGFAISE